ncbi:MAG: transporter substrate-binding protein [Hyphomicrobiales bacterium]|nr:transporter substrate-binding protein [Hyphomicrobiales bacterium]
MLNTSSIKLETDPQRKSSARLTSVIYVVLTIFVLGASLARAENLRATLVIDAEFGHPTSTSAQAIALGARLAVRDMAQAGLPVTLNVRTTDNRGIAAIGSDNFTDAAQDPSVVAVMGGKFSPVQIEVAPLAQALNLMLLDPWGSADAIIDNGFTPNWAFRLSLRDEWASDIFVEAALADGKRRTGVILPNTAWGRSMQSALRSRAQRTGLRIVGERWYNWGEPSLVQRYHDLAADGAETIIVVANEIEGSILFREVAALPENKRLPLLSHWGVTGGNLAQLAGEALGKLDLRIVQTFSFHTPRTPRAIHLRDRVLADTGKAAIRDIESPVGVAHAYDLTWLLALAIQSAGTTNRARVRDALERLGPFEGATRFYDAPFTPDRHEALSRAEVFLARDLPGRGLVPVEP